MDATIDTIRPAWKWSGEAHGVPSVPYEPATTTSSTTGRENQNTERAETMEGIPRARAPWTQFKAESGSQATPTAPGTFKQEEEEQTARATENEDQPPHPERHYKSRKCRICLEVVHPTITPPAEGIPGMFNPPPVVDYISEDPSSGRLIRPCLCRGSMRWIHEGCLQEWRNQSAGSPNFWQCPTCLFKYRLQRMDWGRYISSKAAQLTLTMLILFITVFILGFVADPIINIYLDPYDVITSGGLTDPVVEEGGFWTHLLKGFASLGLLGAIKSLLATSPWQWVYMRSNGILGGGRRGRGTTGRDRMANISWYLVAFGVMTFLWAVYKLVSAWSRRLLDIAGERVADVQGNDDDDDDDEEE